MTITLSHGGDSTFTAAAPSNEILVGTRDGVVRIAREAPGRRWRPAERWLADKHIHALLVEPASGAIVAGASRGSVHVSEDRGASWQRRDDGLTEADVYCLAAVRDNGAARIYAGTEPARLFVSGDLGRHWRELAALRSVDTSAWTFPAPPHVAHAKHICCHPRDPRTMLVCIEQGGLLKTTDGGETFAALPGDGRRRSPSRDRPRRSRPHLSLERCGDLRLERRRRQLAAAHRLRPRDRRLPRLPGGAPARPPPPST